MGQPVIPMFTKVEGIDYTQGPVAGSQLRKHTYTNTVKKQDGVTLCTTQCSFNSMQASTLKQC